MSNLITRSDDERLALGNPETLPSIDDTPQTVDKMHVLRDSLRAALSRAEAAEGALAEEKVRLCRISDAVDEAQAEELDEYVAEIAEIIDANYSPCPHVEEVKRLREALAVMEESDAEWRVKATESFSNGTCPICFCSDGGPHEKGCEWYEMEYRIRILEKSSDLNANIAVSAIDRAADKESRIMALETQLCLIREAHEARWAGISNHTESCTVCAALARLKEKEG